jgi:hypothetical protein
MSINVYVSHNHISSSTQLQVGITHESLKKNIYQSNDLYLSKLPPAELWYKWYNGEDESHEQCFQHAAPTPRHHL